ncbi:MAG: zinc ribbon domain-containing protein [Variovorax sp.]|nr:MAG: zinc ribbon domain-containing protein [Variovorax sp.]
MWCAACSTKIHDGAPYCDQCGAALCGSPSQLAQAEPELPPERGASRGLVLGSAALLGVGLVAGALWWWPSRPAVSSDALQAAMSAAIAGGDVPGRDPVCVANGLAYDQEPVNVQTDNAATISWMNTLVNARLYEAPEPGMSGGFMSQPILVYKPLPALAEWGGSRRLCIAKGVKLVSVANLGRVDDLRLRGKRYTGVPADVRWTLDQPAPWLAQPEVGEALVRELPTWRSARWQSGAAGWRLVQRKNFVHVDEQWVPGDLVERLPARGNAAAAM